MMELKKIASLALLGVSFYSAAIQAGVPDGKYRMTYSDIRSSVTGKPVANLDECKCFVKARSEVINLKANSTILETGKMIPGCSLSDEKILREHQISGTDRMISESKVIWHYKENGKDMKFPLFIVAILKDGKVTDGYTLSEFCSSSFKVEKIG